MKKKITINIYILLSNFYLFINNLVKTERINIFLSKSKKIDLGRITKVLIFFFTLSIINFQICSATEIKEKIEGLTSSSKTIVLSSIYDLSKIHTQESTLALIKQLKKEKDNYIKIKILEALTVHQSTTALAGIIPLLNDQNSYVRQTAVQSIGYFNFDDETIIAISNMLDKEKNDDVKFSALNTLSQKQSKTIVDTIDKVLNKEKNTKLRKFGIRNLEKINTKEAISEIEKYSADSDKEVREEVKKIIEKKKKTK